MLKIITGSHAAPGGGGAQQRGDGVGRVQRGAALLRPRGATPLHHLGQAQVSFYISRNRMSISYLHTQEGIKYHDYYHDYYDGIIICFEGESQ